VSLPPLTSNSDEPGVTRCYNCTDQLMPGRKNFCDKSCHGHWLSKLRENQLMQARWEKEQKEQKRQRKRLRAKTPPKRSARGPHV
jgi:hypothetical protein